MITVEIKPGPNWNKRLTQLLQSIEVRMVNPLEEAVVQATAISSKSAPVFDKESYGEYWQWIFNRLPEYEPEPGALRNAISYVSNEDMAKDSNGYTIGFGNVKRLNEATNRFIGKLPVFVGGRNAGNKQIRKYDTTSLPNGLNRPINTLGYWAIQEYGFRGIIPKNFMMMGKDYINNFWNTRLAGLFHNVALDWNKG